MIGWRDRVNLLLLGVAAALGALILLLPGPRPERTPPAVAFEPDAVERITLERLDRSDTVQLERRDGDWFVTAPERKDADSGRVARALAALRERTPSCYPAGGQNPGEFGLQPPQAVLLLDSTRVEMGYRAPDGRRYIRAGGRLCLVTDITLPILAGQIAETAQGD